MAKIFIVNKNAHAWAFQIINQPKAGYKGNNMEGGVIAILVGICTVVGSLWKFHSTISGKNISVERRLGALESRHNVTDNRVGNLESKISNIDRRLESIEKSMIEQGNNIVRVLTLLDHKQVSKNVSFNRRG